MLVVMCAFCGWTGPLGCSGMFMPHPPMLITLTASGPTCPACGPWPPVYTCPWGHSQYLYVPGVSPMPQQGYTYAPVAQVPPGASDQTIKEKLGDVGLDLGKKFGQGVVQGILGQ